MNIRYAFPSPLEAEVVGITADGKSVKIKEVVVSPFFFRPDAKPVCLFTETQADDGEVIHQFVSTVSGVSGDFKSAKRTPGPSAYDRHKVKAGAKDGAGGQAVLPSRDVLQHGSAGGSSPRRVVKKRKPVDDAGGAAGK